MSHRDEGLAALKAGDLDTALRKLQAAVQEAPADGPAWAAFGVALCQAGRAADGVKALERAISLQPTQARLYYNLGRAQESLQKTAEAVQAYRKAVALDPNHAQAAAAIQRLELVPSRPAGPAVSAAPAVPAPAPPMVPPAAPAPQTGYGTPAPPAAAPYPAGPVSGAAPASPASPWSAPVPPPAAAAGGSLGDFALGAQPVAAPPPGPPAAPGWGTPPAPGGWGQAPVPAPQSEWGPPPQSEWQPAPPRPATPAPVYTPPVAAPQSGGGGEGFNWRALGSAVLVLLGVVVGLARISRRTGWSPFSMFGPSLDKYQAGATLDDSALGLSVKLPQGFPSRPPRRESFPVTTENATQATYDSLVGTRECVFATMYFPAVIWENASDQELFSKLRQQMLTQLNARNPTSRTTQYQGYFAEETRMEGSADNETRNIRMRMVCAPPRVVLVAFGSKDAKDLDKPGIEGFFNSLTIERRPSPSRKPSGVGAGGLQMPNFAAPSMPEPPTPMPMSPPPMPQPSMPPQPSFGPGSPGYPSGPGGPGVMPSGPGGPGYPGGMPSGPSGGPGGPGFSGGPVGNGP